MQEGYSQVQKDDGAATYSVGIWEDSHFIKGTAGIYLWLS